MKLFLLILLVVLIMLIAKGVANQYKEKNLFYTSIMQFLNAYEFNIGFKKDKIKDLVKRTNCKGQAKILFDEYWGYLNDKNKLTLEKIKILADDEKEFLVDLFYKIGTSDYYNEMSQLRVFEKYIQEKIDSTSKDSAKFYPLIIKLSFLFSLGIALVFI